VPLLKFRFVLCAALAASAARAEVKLPAIVSDHMLLQQGMPARIWGTAAPGETVTVSMPAQHLAVKASGSGKWQVFLQPLKPGAPFDLTIGSIVVHDVLVGEVWVGSGQSNMEFPMSRALNSAQEIADANNPQIRLFTVKKAVSEQPLDDVTGSWSLCTPESVKNFSAVAYFFGREIVKTQHVPVGLIHTSWGGTPAQSWTEPSFLKDDLALEPYLTNWQKALDNYPAAKEKYDQQLAKWQEAVTAAKAAGKTPPNRPGPPPGPGHPNTPSGLYNAMIAPLTPYAIRGALWYQGESNANEAWLYRRLFTSMIESWRQAWGQGSFPFYFVQLANYRTNGWWPVLRESQNAALELRHSGMALAIDVGNPADIHPTNKQEVGHRLALVARAQTYGEKVEYSGPLFRQLMVTGAQARLSFDHIGSGLQARGAALTGFEIAGADRKFVPADAKIEGASIVVTSPDVPEPVAVRYAWQDDPQVTLYNREGLPASSFRTDSWKDAKETKPRP
jgi:sialate O-acetylesterase